MSGEEEKIIDISDNVEVVQPFEAPVAEQQTVIQSLKQELDTCKKKLSEIQDSKQRLAADFDNYQKRIIKERQDVERTATNSLIRKLLDVYESLEKAISSVKDAANNEFVDGVKMIYKEFSRILKSEGLEPIPSIGLPLDVYKHEVFMQKVNDELPEDTVLEEIQKGYLLNSFVIRTSKVVVSQKSTQEDIQNLEKTKEEKGD
ncbi:MAG: Hsp70 [Candidatus Brocadiaceae bacterium]|nr:Hsp70 [Candidatus Brocadiaceae bacterium]